MQTELELFPLNCLPMEMVVSRTTRPENGSQHSSQQIHLFLISRNKNNPASHWQHRTALVLEKVNPSVLLPPKGEEEVRLRQPSPQLLLVWSATAFPAPCRRTYVCKPVARHPLRKGKLPSLLPGNRAGTPFCRRTLTRFVIIYRAPFAAASHDSMGQGKTTLVFTAKEM